MNLDICDFDGNYTALCLRILSRLNHPNIAKPSFDWIERSFKTSRESRQYLLQSLRETDSYTFTFVQINGEVRDDIDPNSIPSSPEEVNKEIEITKKNSYYRTTC